MSLVKSLQRPLVSPLINPLTGVTPEIQAAREALVYKWPFNGSLTGSPGSAAVFTRASSKVFLDNRGKYQSYGVNEAAYGSGISLEDDSTNRCTNFNFAPTDLTGVTDGAAVTTTVVNNSNFFAGTEFSDLVDAGFMNGFAYKTVNDGTATNALAAQADISGTTGNTDPVSITVYVRSENGEKVALYLDGTTERASVIASDPNKVYKLSVDGVVPTGGGNRLRVWTSDNDTVRWFGNQLERMPFATSPIKVEGSTATRAADNLSVSTTGFPTTVSIYIRLMSDGLTGGDLYLWESGTNAVWFDDSTSELVASASGFETRLTISSLADCIDGVVWSVDGSNNLTLKACGQESAPVALGGAITWGASLFLARQTAGTLYTNGQYQPLSVFDSADITPEAARWA